MADAAIRVVDLVKRFGDVVAVDHVSFSVSAGSTTGLLGGNGAGKTTTISMILGLLLPSGEKSGCWARTCSGTGIGFCPA